MPHTPAGLQTFLGGLPPKGGVQRGKGGRDSSEIQFGTGVGGLREALEMLASRAERLVLGADCDSKIHVEILFMGFTP